MFEELLNSNTIILILIIINILIFILYILNNIKLSKLRKNYADFMRKMGNGKDVTEMLSQYVERVNNVENETKEIMKYCDKLNGRIDKCYQKIGLVKYNAFRDTGSYLSFSLAILDTENNGFVLNGIYGIDNSNIYAKEVKHGKCNVALSNEEREAIDQAMNN